MKKLKVEKSLYPEEEKTHIVFLYSSSKCGVNCERIFKGTYKECEVYKKRLENANKRHIKIN